MTTAILFGSFFVLFAIGVALGAASLVAIAYIPFLGFGLYALGLVSGIDSFTLIAVVQFTLAGSLMAQGGISRRLIAVAGRAFGRSPGDLGTVTIMACLFFAAISRTGSATVAAIGLAMIPALVNRGYDRAYAGAMVASAGGLGVMIPPSVVMIVYAVSAGVSVTALFMAGVVPGIVIALTLIVYNVLHRRKSPRPARRGCNRRFGLGGDQRRQAGAGDAHRRAGRHLWRHCHADRKRRRCGRLCAGRELFHLSRFAAIGAAEDDARAGPAGLVGTHHHRRLGRLRPHHRAGAHPFGSRAIRAVAHEQQICRAAGGHRAAADRGHLSRDTRRHRDPDAGATVDHDATGS